MYVFKVSLRYVLSTVLSIMYLICTVSCTTFHGRWHIFFYKCMYTCRAFPEPQITREKKINIFSVMETPQSKLNMTQAGCHIVVSNVCFLFVVMWCDSSISCSDVNLLVGHACFWQTVPCCCISNMCLCPSVGGEKEPSISEGVYMEIDETPLDNGLQTPATLTSTQLISNKGGSLHDRFA